MKIKARTPQFTENINFYCVYQRHTRSTYVLSDVSVPVCATHRVCLSGQQCGLGVGGASELGETRARRERGGIVG